MKGTNVHKLRFVEFTLKLEKALYCENSVYL